MTMDRVFAQERAVEDFRFYEQVEGVFDDMVDRSVPFYQEIQRMVCELAADYATPGSHLCDLGCATGTTLALMDSVVSTDVRLTGIDNSPEMLEKCRKKFEQLHSGRTPNLFCHDLKELQLPENISVVSLVLTLMFVRPTYRLAILSSIYESLNTGGALILMEKVVCDSPDLNRRFIRYYYDMKRRHGYSELEISQKREALENVLIPYTENENRQLLADAGFSHVEVFFRWYNFCGMVAVK